MLSLEFPGARKLIDAIDAAVQLPDEAATTDALRTLLCRSIRDQAVRLPYPRLPRQSQLLLQWRDERGEYVQHQGPAPGQDGAQLVVDAGIDHDRAHPVLLAGGANPLAGLGGLGRIVDEGDPVGQKLRAGKLGQQAVANSFSCNSGAVGDVEHRANAGHGSDSLKIPEWGPLQR